MNLEERKKHIFQLKSWCLRHGYRYYGAHCEKDCPTRGLHRLWFDAHVVRYEKCVFDWKDGWPSHWIPVTEAFYSEVSINPDNDKLKGLNHGSQTS